MQIVETETDGDHFLSHYILAKKVLRESTHISIRLAEMFSDIRLTREACEGMVADWKDEGWL